jgi:formamidopyrimidine-DNA glycosylase
VPELPEIEAAARTLAAAVEGKTIARLAALHHALRRRLPDADAARLRGCVIVRVERRGKHQLLHLRGGPLLDVHFRMTGDWSVGRVHDAIAPHARAVLDLTDGTRVSLIDRRALATIELRSGDGTALPHLGPDALDPRLDADALGAALARKRCAIKPALLDQRVVAGLGNVYAAEALWHARISPLAPAARLSAARRARLIDGIRVTLARARRAGARPGGGSAVPRFEVYGRAGDLCRRCGARVVRIVQAGRSTYFCPRCQRR